MILPLQGNPCDGTRISESANQQISELTFLYRMSGWDQEGKPSRAKLEEVGLGWAADELGL